MYIIIITHFLCWRERDELNNENLIKFSFFNMEQDNTREVPLNIDVIRVIFKTNISFIKTIVFVNKIMSRKPKLELPQDCDQLDVSVCEHPKLAGKCKIKHGRWGGRSKCIPNTDHEIDEQIQKEGFKNFAKIDENDLENELSKRDQLCRKLSVDYCRSQRAKALGCSVSSGVLKKKHCKLSQRIIDFYYSRSNSCIMPDCKEVREKYKKLCFEHQTEFDNMLELIAQAYVDLTQHHENDDENLQNFEEIYLYLKDYYGIYLLEKPATLVKIEEMAMNVRKILGYGNCQCYNINECIGSGEKGNQCKNKMIKSEIGYVCKKHKKCIIDRMKDYKKLRDNFEVMCKKESCGALLTRCKELYSMIKFSTEGEISVLKNEIYEIIIIIEQYISEIK